MRGKLVVAMISACIGILLLGGISFACDWVEERQERQYRRIDEGVRTGQITPAEERYLLQQEERIEKAMRKALRDGCLEPWEARRLERLLDRASEDIYWARHNRSRRKVCRPFWIPPRPRVRRPVVAYGLPRRPHFFVSGFFSEPSWGIGWFIADP